MRAWQTGSAALIARIASPQGFRFQNVIVVMQLYFPLVNLLLLIDTELSRAAVYKKQQTTDDGKNLEEIVLGKILVRVVLV